MPIESVMPSSHLIFCRPLLLLPPIPPSIRVFSNKSTLRSAKAMPKGLAMETGVLDLGVSDSAAMGVGGRHGTFGLGATCWA